MKKFFRLVLFGFLSWLLTFVASICLFPLKKQDARLFETLMSMVLTACAVGFTVLYFRKTQASFLREGILLGAAFVGCNILFDLPMFSAGPMQMPLARYFKEIGFVYFAMPIITIGFAYALGSAMRPHPEPLGFSKSAMA
jgi:hypothetical protein